MSRSNRLTKVGDTVVLVAVRRCHAPLSSGTARRPARGRVSRWLRSARAREPRSATSKAVHPSAPFDRSGAIALQGPATTVQLVAVRTTPDLQSRRQPLGVAMD
ncbi:hypothetical protein PR202_ga03685 [Eleusine coracana subsp. coracana]|uniref:Uncharacterized protein n=1 Tax=Eleusine coracana subsp. coracana TaxID=191504 RepID=A0AAV5BN30_ELECO|nr:hypothetical protein PR202_ga03685 [Eleusine coracana subsp. coracana]